MPTGRNVEVAFTGRGKTLHCGGRCFTCPAPQAPWSAVAPATAFSGSRFKGVRAAARVEGSSWRYRTPRCLRHSDYQSNSEPMNQIIVARNNRALLLGTVGDSGHNSQFTFYRTADLKDVLPILFNFRGSDAIDFKQFARISGPGLNDPV